MTAKERHETEQKGPRRRVERRRECRVERVDEGMTVSEKIRLQPVVEAVPTNPVVLRVDHDENTQEQARAGNEGEPPSELPFRSGVVHCDARGREVLRGGPF